jgi:hypothetical protein
VSGQPQINLQGAKIMSTGFQQFLREKAEKYGVPERHRDRAEWLLAITKLLDQIREWLKASDPEELTDIVPYVVQRVERPLGIYDAPAMKIRLGAAEVSIVPIGRYAIGPVPAKILSHSGLEEASGPVAGRVDITNGERKYLLLRNVSTGQDRWYALDERSNATLLDQSRLETILQDLWS